MAFNLFKGIRMSKTDQNPPTNLSWKVAASALKSRVFVRSQYCLS